ncbi:hypothetical protein SAMN05421819_4425 [Bryocella elongata]|uniref:Tetratricopeptide repeat-containing protein n=1 Tax=Bryocella elongata TaxID=863522 RepID=A0A1H6CBL6_9BACT|nr:hypothetical protein [Bryocella elongata]SEG70288.1 hypothetical protein SAMN05421819_4425 [Bryocella elongata]
MSSPNSIRFFHRPSYRIGAGIVVAAAALAGLRAGATSEWLEHAIANTPVEAALYRAMSLPGVEVLFPRPPKESVAELDKLVAAKPTPALYSLRARQEEAAQQFDRAEADWKSYVAKSTDQPAAMVELADFYQRRHQVKAEFEEQLKIGESAPARSDATTPPTNQRSWHAFERAMELANEQAFDDAVVRAALQRWAARYPLQPVYQHAFVWELDHAHATEAEQWIQRYRTTFPHELVFPVKAEALLALRTGGKDAPAKALEVYDSAFQPLWPEDLQKSYFALLADIHRTRDFLSQANARLQAKPDDYEAEARVFTYYREQGRLQQALDSLDSYRAGKEQRHAAWSAQELYTFAQLTTLTASYPEAARYNFALAETKGQLTDGRSAHEAGLAGMVNVLLSAPEAGTSLGAGNLSMYRDIATLDQGPGYWNGVLSLWLNGQSPESEYAQEDAKAQPYFHRAKAAELLAQLDHDAPQSPDRPALHAKLLDAYVAYGDDPAVIREGTAFLDAFPKADDRVRVAFALADVYARQKNSTAEFALYDRLLSELSQQAGARPLTSASPRFSSGPRVQFNPSEQDAPATPKSKAERSSAFELNVSDPQLPTNEAASEYSQVLERYLARLTELRQLPQALAVLRHELDRSPDDPAIYDRLAQFLEGNNLSAQTEELYRTAIARFKGEDWYSKLARFYLRHKRTNDYATLTRNVTRIFNGTQVDTWFRTVSGGGPQLALQLNLFAHDRFPHDTVFIDNLLNDYQAKPTRDDAAWEALLRHTWWESPELTQRYFEFLSSSGKLDAEVAKLGDAPSNPAAVRELATAEMWRSHFEQSAPLYVSLAEQYPADEETGTRAADLQRSLAWLDPMGPAAKIASAVAIENRLLASNPGDTARLERIGDILADHADGNPQSLAASAAYWRRIPAIAPGETQPYLEAATVFWDYFQFDDALHEIQLGRTHFARPALFGYEAGAIAEAKNDSSAAITEYVAASLESGPEEDTYSPARTRLLTLAHRPATAKLADSATAAALASHPSVAALRLRIAVLEEQQRAKEVGPLLTQALARVTTEDEAAEIASYAGAHDQPAVQEAALDRQASLATDPVERLQLRYSLAGVYEGQGDNANAARVVDAVYHDEPKILGVVRATVDFDWRLKRQQEAVKVLLEAAHAAQPELSQQFLAEASEKANSAGDTVQARSIAESLLAHDPYNTRDLALVAATYVNDPAGLASFYHARLDALHADTMPAEDRKARTALLRRGLIPALTRSKGYAGAVDQYIALLSAYPEDDGLINEAALYALRYDRKQQWLDFLTTTTKASPRDSRFFVALAISQVIFSDPSAAVDAYAHAIAIRRDRADWYAAKASLDDTLGRFDDEVADDTRLYQLSYQDPQWMIAAARTRARQGRTADAIAALELAFLHGAQTTPHDYIALAAQLELWNMIPQAQHDAELGARMAGAELLHAEGRRIEESDAASYARIMTRAQAAPAAMTALQASLDEATASPVVDAMLAQLKQQGPLGVTDAEWRARYTAMRKQEAAAAFTNALQEMCRTADAYDTPEERASFAAMLQAQGSRASNQDLRQRWIPAAETAHLAELQEHWRTHILLSADQQSGDQLRPLISLQHARLRFKDLLQTLTTYVGPAPKPGTREDALVEMLRVTAATGDTDALLRMVHQQVALIETDASAQQIVLREIVQRAPQQLIALASSSNDAFADTVANTALAEVQPPLSLQVVAARGSKLEPIWGAEYHGLASLYVGDATPPAGAAFRSALAWDRSIGERVQRKPDATQELTGVPWFYLAARYGQWMSLPGTHADYESAMAADLESSADVDSYRTLATSYAEAGHPEAALLQIAHARELSPENAELDDAAATLLWNMNRKPDAITAWRRAYSDLRVLEDKGGAVPESFWIDFAAITQHTSRRGLTQELQSAREDVLRTYLARNGSYRSTELLHAEYSAWADQKVALSHLFALASSAKAEFDVLNGLDAEPWLVDRARVAVLERELQLLRAASKDPARAEDYASWQYKRSGILSNLLTLYLADGQTSEAHGLLQSLTDKERAEDAFQQAAVVIAARSGGLPALLASYAADDETAPGVTALEAAAAQLSTAKEYQPARSVLEFVFTRAQSAHELTPKEYLLLAEARLKTDDVSDAVATLEALIRSGGDAAGNLDSAASLLERNDHLAEALPFLTRLAASVPWEMSYTVRLAEAQSKAHAGQPATALHAVASDNSAPYALRVRAARDLRSLHADGHGLGSGELDLLASDTLDASASAQPYFTLARAAAAEHTSDPATKRTLLQDAIAIAPFGPGADAMRQQLFLAEYSTRQMREARTVLDEWMAVRSSTPAAQPWSSNDAGADAMNADAQDDSVISSGRATASSTADADLDKAMAEVYLATNDRAQAINALQREASVLGDVPAAKPVLAQIEQLQDLTRRDAANAARRPLIHRELAQAAVVRVRLEQPPEDDVAVSSREDQP